jgi:hypothetical protein
MGYRYLARFALILSVLAVFTLSVTAQQASGEDSCTPVITEAVTKSTDICSGMDRNTVCYGNNLVESIQRTADSTTPFEAPGDKIPLTELQSLDLSGYDPETSDWGIAILTVQANLPDTLPGQGVTLILFGDSTVEDNSANVIAAEDQTFSPMQAIRLTSGIGKTDCAAAPNGLLVQTPKGAASVQFNINGISVELGSTAFIRLHETEDGDPFLDFELLEGHTTMQVEEGEPVTLEGGFGVDVPVDEEGMAADQPGEPEPITDYGSVLPLLDLLPDEITLPESIEPTGTEEAGTASSPGDTGIIPRAGKYHISVLSHTNNGCSQQMVDSLLHFMVQDTTLTEEKRQHYIETGELFMGESLEALPNLRVINETTIQVTIDAEITSESCSVTLETQGDWTGE